MIENNSSFINDDFLQNEKFKNLLFKSSNTVSEFVSIQEGCDKFCSFCVVPYTRGSEFSRSINEIKEEIKKYIDNGLKKLFYLVKMSMRIMTIVKVENMQILLI